MKRILTFVLALFSTVVLATPQEDLQVRYTIAQKVVYIQNENGSCTGTFVNHEGAVRLLTNSHCCISSTMKVFDGDEETIVSVLKQDEDYDLCELENKFPDRLGFDLSETVSPFEDSYSTGYPAGRFSLDKGILQNIYPVYYTDTKISVKLISTSYAYPGISGGALTNDRGQLLGIIHQYITYNMNSVAIAVPTIEKFLAPNE